ncbi:MAG: four helix bundle protein [Vicinamibacteria bacterium]
MNVNEHVDVDSRMDFHSLDVYQAALRVQELLPELTASCGHSLRDQFQRAATSILLNVAEGCGRRGRRDRARFFSMARGSAMECGAIVDIIEVRRCAPVVAGRQGRALLVRIVSMLTRMEQRARG